MKLIGMFCLSMLTFKVVSSQSITVIKDTIRQKTGIQSVIFFDSTLSALSLFEGTKKITQLKPHLFSTGNANDIAAGIDELIPYHVNNAISHVALFKNDKPLMLYDSEKLELVAKMIVRHEGKAATTLRRAFAELNLVFQFKNGKCRITCDEILVHVVNAYNNNEEPKVYTWDELKKLDLAKKSMQWLSNTVITSLEEFVVKYKSETVKIVKENPVDDNW